ncbi:MAG: glycerate kinase [Halobacteriaceae archaeon]
MIRNRAALERSPAHRVALDCVAAGIEAAHPRRVVRDRVALDGDTLAVGDATYDLGDYREVVVLGGGKAAAGVAAALEAVLGDRLDGGAVVTDAPADTEGVAVLAGDHPVPGEESVAGTREVLARADDAGAGTLVLAVLTGGGSALLAAPAVDLDTMRETTEALLESGATIHEVNAVRKHLSAVKGGQLARRAAPATVVTLALSDVVGNDLDVIASGPTVPDTTTFDDALDALDRHDVQVPASARDRLERGARGEVAETPGADDPAVAAADAHVLADGFTALAAARDAVPDEYGTLVLSSRVRGEAREAALTHAAVAEECRATGNPIAPPAVVLSGGETTVTVAGGGTGGPNLEFGLRAAIELDDATLAAVDTDGRDGSTDAAGALVDGGTVGDPAAALAALAANDVHPYLADRDALVETGATGTNVNDLRVLVVE